MQVPSWAAQKGVSIGIWPILGKEIQKFPHFNKKTNLQFDIYMEPRRSEQCVYYDESIFVMLST